jgi:hypothetical protein
LHDTLDSLDDTHLMRMAGVIPGACAVWAKKHNIPVIYCKAVERKHRIAEEHRPSAPKFQGIFAVLVNKAPAPVWQVLRFKGGGSISSGGSRWRASITTRSTSWMRNGVTLR